MRRAGAAICEYSILSFALWTMASHLTVLIGGNLFVLLGIFGGTSLLLGVWLWLRRCASERTQCRSAAGDAEPWKRPTSHSLMWLLVLFAVVITLVAHRPDPDDCRYINRAVSVADNPHAPILQAEDRHLIEGVTVPIPSAEQLLANETLAGALAWLTRVPAIGIVHLVFAPFAAMLLILAYSELFRILAPQRWAYGVLAVVVFLCANGQVHHSYGNFAFVRLHQGKGVLVSVIVPLTIVYAWRCVSRPTLRNWLLLGAVQIAAIGMSLTGLMIGPVVAWLTILVRLPDIKTWSVRFKRGLIGLASSGYLIGIGLCYTVLPLIRAYSDPLHPGNVLAPGRVTTFLQPSPHRYPALFMTSVHDVFGSGRFAILCSLVVLTAWFWCTTKIARRLCLVFPLAVGLFFANPWMAEVLARSVMDQESYQRVFWLVPLPAMAGLTLLAPLSWKRARLSVRGPGWERGESWVRVGLFLLLLILLPTVLSTRHIFAPANRVSLRWPGLKVPPEYAIAKAIQAAVPDRSQVLAPEEVSLWLPTLHHHPYPLVSRFRYASRLRGQAPERRALTRYAMGQREPDGGGAALREGIAKYRLAAVCIRQDNHWIAGIHDVLMTTHFELHQVLLGHEVWVRSSVGRISSWDQDMVDALPTPAVQRDSESERRIACQAVEE